jgi:hypothetical protein
MTSQGRGKRSKALGFDASAIQSHSDDTSMHRTPNCDDIRRRAYEVYLERGSLPGNELDDWLQAERELSGSVLQESSTVDIEGNGS